jgi:D-sedoheptulose 7-phosphate isomerase
VSQTSLQTPRAKRGSFAAAPETLVRALELRRAQTAALSAGIDALCAACADLATRIAAGGRLYVLGSGNARPDARHLALEFLHPVIVGKRAVPALALDPAEEPRAIERSGSAGDAAIAVIGPEPAAEVWRALAAARECGLLALVLASARAGDSRPPGLHWLDPGASDPRLAKEGRVATYHLLWELTHVLLEDAERVGAPDAAWGQLYPFLDASRATRETVHADLRASGAAKLRAQGELRDATVGGQAAILAQCAEAIGEALCGGAQLWSFGNGGSQTDADWIAECFAGGDRDPAWRARSLAGDPAVLTALANDVGFERVFARQIAAFARAGDVALGISTSGSSENVVAGLAEAKRLGLLTVGLAGGDGGRLARSDDVDFLLVVPSDSVHRIQEVQATLYHLLYELARSSAGPGDRRCAS